MATALAERPPAALARRPGPWWTVGAAALVGSPFRVADVPRGETSAAPAPTGVPRTGWHHARVPPDPLAPLVDLPGVADAVARARSAVVAVHNHPANRRGWPAGAAQARLRAARASAALDGARLDPGSDGPVTDPVLAGAVRVAEESGRLLGVWRTAPLQALARLHVVAAADLVEADRRAVELGRPGVPVPTFDPASRSSETMLDPASRSSAEVSARLSLLAGLVTGGTAVPAPVLVAVVHGELLALAPFPSANGVVARGAARLTAVAAGLDPKGLAVPEVGHLRRAAEYRTAAAAFAGGTPDGLRTWLLHCCAQWEAGAREGTSIAEARS